MRLPDFPLLLFPLRQDLHDLGVGFAQHPKILLRNNVHLSVPTRVDECLHLDVLRLVLLHDRAANTCDHAKGVQLQLFRTRVLELGVQAVAAALDLGEGAVGGAAVGLIRHRTICARLIHRSACSHHADVLQ